MSVTLQIILGLLGIAVALAVNWVIWPFNYRLVRDLVRRFQDRKKLN